MSGQVCPMGVVDTFDPATAPALTERVEADGPYCPAGDRPVAMVCEEHGLQDAVLDVTDVNPGDWAVVLRCGDVLVGYVEEVW